jgi:hypothetical protein
MCWHDTLAALLTQEIVLLREKQQQLQSVGSTRQVGAAAGEEGQELQEARELENEEDLEEEEEEDIFGQEVEGGNEGADSDSSGDDGGGNSSEDERQLGMEGRDF